MDNIVTETLAKIYEETGYTRSAIERIFGLPQKSLLEPPSAETIMFMQMLKTYPWLVSVAEKGFDEVEAKKIMLRSACEVLCESIDKEGIKDANRYSV